MKLMKLYIYDHCPFCIKAMMIFGLKQQAYDMEVLLNDDIETPTAMIGKKMVPILEKDDGSYMAESLDIIHYVDQLDQRPIVTGVINQPVTQWLEKHQGAMQLLTIPRAVQLAFSALSTKGARAFYIRAKTEWVGDFQALIDSSEGYISDMNAALKELEPMIDGDQWLAKHVSETDFHLFAALRGLSGVKGIHYPDAVAAYLNRASQQSHIPLLLSRAI